MGNLTRRQTQVLRMLSRGMSYREIKKEINTSLGNVHILCWKIRKITGIKSTKDRDECRMHRINSPVGPHKKEVTPTQKRILHMLIAGMSYKEIKQATGLGNQTIQDHAHDGCKRLGISGRGQQRLSQLRAALGVNTPSPPVTMDDPFFN